ncbi:MAG TPA: hypothetical protein VFA38_05020 [Nitrospirales bacterium]|nr:hypothetical protein [Nitrospirales bacterium]
MEKEVRDFLRYADLLIARIQTAKPLRNADVTLVESYLARIKAVLLTLEGFEHIEKSRNLQDRSSDKR